MEKLQLENFGLVEMSSEEMVNVEGGFWGLLAVAVAGFLAGMAYWVYEQIS